MDKLPLSDDCTLGLKKIGEEVLQDSADENLGSYFSRYLNKKRQFFKEITNDEAMKFSGFMIVKPLLKSGNVIEKECIKLFKHLLSYMELRESSKKPIEHVFNHINLCLKMGGNIYDEAYLQVLKQITDNPNEESRNKAWNFFAILASSFAPDTKLYYCLINYLRDEIKENPDPEITKRANYIIVRLFNTFNSRRKFLISEEEIKSIEQMKPLMLQVYFFSETYISVPYESYYTLGDVKYFLMNKLKLKIGRIPYFSMYEVCDKGDTTEERILEEEEKVVNIKAMWDFDTERFKKNNENCQFRIYLKLLLFYDFTEDDIDTITLSFFQTKYDVIHSKMNLTDDDISKLAALQIVATYGNIPHEKARDMLEKEISEFVPLSKQKKIESAYWIKTIMEEYVDVDQVYTKLEARRNYLDYLKENTFYEAHVFYAKFDKKTYGNENLYKTKESKFVPDRILALKPKGIAICDTNKELLEFFEYTEISYWGYNGNTFILVIPDQKELNKFTKYYFESFQIRSLYVIAQSYSYLIAQMTLQEMTRNINENISRFNDLPKSSMVKETSVLGLRNLYSTTFKK